MQPDGDEDEGEGSQRRSDRFEHGGESSGRGMRPAGRSDVGGEESASQAAERDEVDGDYCVSLATGGRDGASVGEGGDAASAGYEDRDTEDFDAAWARNEDTPCCETIQGSGIRV